MKALPVVFVFACVAGLIAVAGGCTNAPSSEEPDPRVGRVASPIINGTVALEGFTVVAAQPFPAGYQQCVMTMLTPTLGLVPRSCVVITDAKPYACDSSGEPSVGSGGQVVAEFDIRKLEIYVGANSAFGPGSRPPEARGARVFDDAAKTLCSHNLAVVELDRAVDGPVAKLRLNERPRGGADSDLLSIEGWGPDITVVNGKTVQQRNDARRRLTGLRALEVGPEVPAPTGNVAPRTLTTGQGPCEPGDVGAPAFTDTGAVLAIFSRLSDVGPAPTECVGDKVLARYMVVADFAPVLRKAFDETKSLPQLEGRTSPGWYAEGEHCLNESTCSSRFCKGGRCAPSCVESPSSCTAGTQCDAGTRQCVAIPPPANAGPEGDAGAPIQPASPGASEVSCSLSPGSLAKKSSGSAGALALLALLVVARRRSRRHGGPIVASST